MSNESVYIIAEAGQNHNGQMKMAKQLIDMAAMPVMDKAFNRELDGVNAIKFTKRDLSEELTGDAAQMVYDSPNSFGKTYGEHREKLELTYDQHIELYHYTKEKELDYIETLTSLKTLKLLEKINIRYIKVASRDISNIQLLDEIGKSRKAVILSTGMSRLKEIDLAIETINRYHEKIILLHCISQYPADYSNLNLNAIPFMKERYKYEIGYSDHSIGIIAPAIAVALGASFIEKHITLSHSLKGSDHKSALEPQGLWRMVRDIRNMEMAMGKYVKELNNVVEPFKTKLERSLCTNKKILKGELIKEKDLIMLSPGDGFKWHDKELFIDKSASYNINENTKLTLDMVSI